MAQSTAGQIPALTGLRFFLALHVVSFHLLASNLITPPELVAVVVQRGYLAVSTFFVLSGFVLAYAYLGQRNDNTVHRIRFWAARFARIYPVYALSLLVSLPIFVPLMSHDPVLFGLSMVSAPAMVQSWWPATSELWNGPAWSLSAEAFFYLLFPFLAPRLIRLSTGRILGLLGLVWVASWGLPYALDRLSLTEHAMHNPAIRLPEFVVGVLLGCLFLRRVGQSTHPGFVWPAVAAVALAGAIVGYVGVRNVQLSVVGPGMFLPLYALLVFALAASSHGIARVLSFAPVVLLGEASYAMYLLHMPFIWFEDRAVRQLAWLQPYAGTPGFAVLLVGAIIGVSVLAFVCVERPARAALRRRLGGQRHAGAALLVDSAVHGNARIRL